MRMRSKSRPKNGLFDVRDCGNLDSKGVLLKSGTGRDRRGTSHPVPATKIRDRTERETAFSSLFLEVGGTDNKVYCYIRIYLTNLI